MATMYHGRATVNSIFQNGISQNTTCANKDSFCKSSHIILVTILPNLTPILPLRIMDHLFSYILAVLEEMENMQLLKNVLSHIHQSCFLLVTVCSPCCFFPYSVFFLLF